MRCAGQRHRRQFTGKTNVARGWRIVCPEPSSENRGAGSGGVEGQRGLQAPEGGRGGEGTGGTRRTRGTPTSTLLLALALGHSLVCSGNQRTGGRRIQPQRSQKETR